MSRNTAELIGASACLACADGTWCIFLLQVIIHLKILEIQPCALIHSAPFAPPHPTLPRPALRCPSLPLPTPPCRIPLPTWGIILMLLPTYALLLFVLLMPFYNGSIATMVRG